MANTKKFQTESRQILDLMIHSIYSNKEIFLRELISNASDALDKRHFYALQDQRYAADELKIELEIDKEKRTILVRDTGIGMTEAELNTNLGVIAHSGSKDFVQQLSEDEKADIIGQFGVGFYSSFIVAQEVEVFTKTIDGDAFRWVSTGEDEYTIEPAYKGEVGTDIILHLREGEDYDIFLDEYQIQRLVKKYSDYIKYPIYLDMEQETPKLDETGQVIPGEYETEHKVEVVNSQIALWKRNKKDVSPEEYDSFYMSEFNDYQKPLHVIHTSAEGQLSYDALLYIPASKSYDFYHQTYQKGLQLYSKGVLIEENCEGLITDAFRFVRGLVDSPDVSLNISREMLQQDKQVEKIAKNIETKIKRELEKMQKKDRETYDTFYEEFGLQLMYSMYDQFGAKKEMLKDLIMFKTSTSAGKYVTLAEYVERMNEDQNAIYYVVGSSSEMINKLPQMESLLEHGIEVLYFLNDVDEFAVRILDTYQEKPFQSITQGDFDFADAAVKEALEQKQVENKDLLAKIKEALATEVSDVRLTSRLKNSAVCLVGGEGLSLEMEKVLAQNPGALQGMRAERILEINPEHALFKALEKIEQDQADKLPLYARLLYKQALLIEGFPIEDMVAYTNELTELMITAAK